MIKGQKLEVTQNHIKEVHISGKVIFQKKSRKYVNTQKTSTANNDTW